MCAQLLKKLQPKAVRGVAAHSSSEDKVQLQWALHPQPDHGIFLILARSHQSTCLSPSGEGLALIPRYFWQALRPKFHMWQSMGQGSFLAAANPFFWADKGSEAGVAVREPGGCQKERLRPRCGSCCCPGPARPFVPLNPAQASEKLCPLLHGRGKGTASDHSSKADCPKRKGICRPWFRLCLGAEAGPAGEARPCLAVSYPALPSPASPCPAVPVPAGGGRGREGAAEAQRAGSGSSGPGTAPCGTECLLENRPLAEIGRHCPLSASSPFPSSPSPPPSSAPSLLLPCATEAFSDRLFPALLSAAFLRPAVNVCRLS